MRKSILVMKKLLKVMAVILSLWILSACNAGTGETLPTDVTDKLRQAELQSLESVQIARENAALREQEIDARVEAILEADAAEKSMIADAKAAKEVESVAAELADSVQVAAVVEAAVVIEEEAPVVVEIENTPDLEVKSDPVNSEKKEESSNLGDATIPSLLLTPYTGDTGG